MALSAAAIALCVQQYLAIFLNTAKGSAD